MVPCVYVLLQRGDVAFPSQIHAYQLFDSDHPEAVVVAAEACVPEIVAVDTAHFTPLVHVGAALEFGVGVALVLQIRR